MNNLKNEEHGFIQTLRELRNKGYCWAKIYLAEERNISIILDDFKYMTANVVPSDFKIVPSCGPLSAFVDQIKFEKVSNYEMNFEKFKKAFEDKYNEQSDKMEYEECLAWVLKSFNNILYKPIKKTEITMCGDFAIIDYIFSDIVEILEDRILPRNITINTNAIIKIVPFGLIREIDDERFVRAIEIVEKYKTKLSDQ